MIEQRINMHTDLEYNEAIEIIRKAMKGLDYRSILSANNITLDKHTYIQALNEAALINVVNSCSSTIGLDVVREQLEDIIISNGQMKQI